VQAPPIVTSVMLSSCSLLATPQVLASLSELAIPHLTSASIFAVTKAGSESLFHHNVRLLCVRPRILHLSLTLAARTLGTRALASARWELRCRMHACNKSRTVLVSYERTSEH